MLQTIAVIFGVIGALISYYYFQKKPTVPGLPPGPKPLPFVGNILDVPPKGVLEYQHWLKFKDCYGPISSITILGQTLVLIHDCRMAHDLLEKNSIKTSGRPTFLFASDLCGLDIFLSMKQCNSAFRFQRKLVHQQMGTKAAAARFHDIQDLESRRLLLRTLDDPTKLFQHIKNEASAIILKLTYGYSIERHTTDPLVALIERMMNNSMEAVMPMRWSVDILPILKHLPEGFPGLSFKKTARKWKEITRMTVEIPYQFVLNQMAKGTQQSSFVSANIEEFNNGKRKGSEVCNSGEEDYKKQVMAAAGVMYAAGSETTVNTIITFVLAMIKFPAVQKKAQEEIDTVTGSDKLPGFEERKKLPYVSALVKELMRWSPVTPLGLAHMTSEEIVYEGYRIPEGAYMIPAVWWFTHDPKVYSDPHSFDPERYFEPRNEPDPASEVFGYGRRVCPGRYVADDSIFLSIARLLAVFDIEKAIDQHGKGIEPELEISPGLLSRPRDFPYRITPRSDKHREMIKSVETEYPWEKSDASSLGKISIE